MVLSWIYQQSIKKLRAAKISSPQKATLILICYALKISKEDFYKELNNLKINYRKQKQIEILVERATNFEPIQYITKQAEFCGLNFYVDRRVFIPRPETEFLVEEIIKTINNKQFRPKDDQPLVETINNIVDIGTGSGCIIISIAKQLQQLKHLRFNFYATDISKDALAVAKKNAKIHKVKVEFLQGDLLASIQNLIRLRQRRMVDKIQNYILVANLPYIPIEDIKNLEKNIREFEPKIALEGGKEGLDLYCRFFKQLKKLKNKPQKIFLEIGFNQGKKIKGLVKKILPDAKIKIKKDLVGFDRIAIISF